jgi:ABC-2 type transport system permease protein
MNDVNVAAESKTGVLARQSEVFQRLRWHLLKNTLGEAAQGSTLRLVIILIFSALIWGGIFGVSAEAFFFLRHTRIPLAGGIVGLVFDFLFVTLGVLLIFSSGIILYSSLFSAEETSFLLSTPATADQVFAYKFQGAITFSSWAFVLLGSPMLVAFGLAYHVPWYYYALLPFYFIGFVLLPGALGAFLCLLMVNFMPRRSKEVLAVAAVAAVTAVAFWIQSIRPQGDWTVNLNRDFLQRLVGQFAVAQGPLSPNHWLSQGIQAAARGDLKKTGYYLALVWSNGLFLYVLMTWLSGRLYRRGYDRVAAGGSMRRRYGGAWLDRGLSGVVGFLDPQTRLLIVKDFRTFRRDPAQWAQVVIFMGLMVLYFANVRRFYQEDIGTYQNGVSLMNLAATALLLCAYTGRFIFPMLSLEGRKFWILGLLPLERERLVWGKFAFSATWALLVAEVLVVFSDWMLGLPGRMLAIHALTVAVVALGLSGLSVGLGASMPNFRESDPSKIAVGFGGTLNLIVGLLFLLLVVGAMAAPWHLDMWQRQVAIDENAEGVSSVWLGLGALAGLALGAAAVLMPLRMGARALKRMEF